MKTLFLEELSYYLSQVHLSRETALLSYLDPYSYKCILFNFLSLIYLYKPKFIWIKSTVCLNSNLSGENTLVIYQSFYLSRKILELINNNLKSRKYDTMFQKWHLKYKVQTELWMRIINETHCYFDGQFRL